MHRIPAGTDKSQVVRNSRIVSMEYGIVLEDGSVSILTDGRSSQFIVLSCLTFLLYLKSLNSSVLLYYISQIQYLNLKEAIDRPIEVQIKTTML